MSAPARRPDPALRSRVVAAGAFTAVSAGLAAVAAWPVYASPGFVLLVLVPCPLLRRSWP